MGTVTILPETTREPITLIGQRAGVCWGSVDSPEANYKRGLECIEADHGRVLEFVNVEMVLDGYSARVIREWYTHIGGMPTRLQASTRRIDYGDFDYVTPWSIKSCVESCAIYDSVMGTIRSAIAELEEYGVPREDCALLLPLGMTTRVVDKRNLRNLIDMSHTRMCARANWEFRELFDDVAHALIAYGDEWEWICNMYFKPKCEVLGRCPEKNGCKKEEGA